MLKSLLIIFSILFLSLALNYLCQTFLKEFEVLLLVTFSIFASFILLSSNDLITLYLGIEAQSLCLYVLAAMRKTSQFSSEAGLKYFILGALSSSLLLFGMSFIYGTIGSTNFDVITKTLSSLVDRHECLPAMLTIGFICVLCSLLFKIAAVPFHM
jgi:NADH-quinone oxidoreductase subunit N